MFDLHYLNSERIKEELSILELLAEEQQEMFVDIVEAFNQKLVNTILDGAVEYEKREFLDKFHKGDVLEVIEFIRVRPPLEEKIQTEAENFEDEIILEIKRVAAENL